MEYLHSIHGQGIWRIKAIKDPPTYDTLAKLMTPLVAEKRGILRSKLMELGADRLSNLNEKHYFGFRKFLLNL